MAKRTKDTPLTAPPRYDDPELTRQLAAGRAAKIQAADAELSEEEKTALTADLARELIRGKKQGRVGLVDLAEASVHAFRGANGIAARLRIEYEHAPVGSRQRTDILKILKDMLQNLKENQEQTAVSSISDEEIEREIMEMISGAQQQRDTGSPKTARGKRLLTDALMAEGENEYAQLEQEIKALDDNHEIDLLAADMLAKASNEGMAEKGISGAIIPDEETEDADFDSIEYVEE